MKMDTIKIIDIEDLKEMDLDELERIENKVWKYDRTLSAIIKIKELEKELKDSEVKNGNRKK